MKWTASKVDLLKSRLARKWKADEIASSFGISENAVAKKAQSLGLSLKGGVPLKRRGNPKSKPGNMATRSARFGRPKLGVIESSTPVEPPVPSGPPVDPEVTRPPTDAELGLRREGGVVTINPPAR